MIFTWEFSDIRSGLVVTDKKGGGEWREHYLIVQAGAGSDGSFNLYGIVALIDGIRIVNAISAVDMVQHLNESEYIPVWKGPLNANEEVSKAAKYVVTKEGVYRHEIMGIFEYFVDAKWEADFYARKDDYHTYEIRPYDLNEVLHKIHPVLGTWPGRPRYIEPEALYVAQPAYEESK